MPFRDRIEAGQRLAQLLENYRGQDAVIYALPRGGVQLGAEIAKHLDIPLDVFFVRKIGAPENPEYAIGAIADGFTPIVVRNDDMISHTRATSAEFDAICRHELAEIERRRKLYVGSQPPIDPKGKIAIVVDDGIATGATALVALKALRQRDPKTLILAVPVGSQEAIRRLRLYADDIVCPETPRDFGALGYFYSDFRQLTDQDVINILASLRTRSKDRSKATESTSGRLKLRNL